VLTEGRQVLLSLNISNKPALSRLTDRKSTLVGGYMIAWKKISGSTSTPFECHFEIVANAVLHKNVNNGRQQKAVVALKRTATSNLTVMKLRTHTQLRVATRRQQYCAFSHGT
jgi:hypothetical protein